MKQLIIIASILVVFSLSIVCNPGKPVDTDLGIDTLGTFYIDSVGQITVSGYSDSLEWVYWSDSIKYTPVTTILYVGDNELMLEQNGEVSFNGKLIATDTALVNLLYKLCAH